MTRIQAEDSNDNPDDDNPTEKFPIARDDWAAIELAEEIARQLLKHPRITPIKIVGLGNALYALGKLPNITVGSSCKFGITYRHGDEDFSEMRYIEIGISETSFSISTGGSVYDKAVGSDSFSTLDWVIESSGYKSTEGELYSIGSSVSEYLMLGAEITVSDASEIEFE
jgi:hypothetical protein